MRRIKRVGVFGALAVIGSVSVAATAAGQSHAAARPKSSGSVTLDFPSWQENEAGYGPWWTAMVKEFERDHPGVKINFYEVGYTSYVQTMLTRFAAGDPPDILDLPAVDEPEFALQSDLTNLDSDLKADGNLTAKWIRNESFLEQHGHYYGLLLQNSGFVLYYNKSILAAHHLSVPTTTSELLKEAKELTGNGQYGIALPTAEDPNLYLFVSAFVTGLGQSWIKNNGWNATSSGVVHALNIYRSLAGDAPPGDASAEAEQIYMAGKAAFYMGIESADTTLETSSLASVRNSGIAALPLPHQVGYVSSSVQIPVSLSPARRKLVWEFIEQLATRGSQNLFIKLTGSLAGLKASNQAEGKLMPSPSVEADAVNGASVIPDVSWFQANYPTFNTDFGKGLSQLLSTSGSTKSLAAQLQSSLPSAG